MNQSEMIGSRLKEERLQQKLTLKQLSEKVGLSIGYLSQVERGYGTLSLSALKKLSSALGLEMSTFFAVSYTHLDAKKGQAFLQALLLHLNLLSEDYEGTIQVNLSEVYNNA